MSGKTEAAASAGATSSGRVRRERRRFTTEEKARIAEAASAPGASVAGVALSHGLNANLVFTWRKLYRAGRLGQRRAPAELLPVKLIGPGVEAVAEEAVAGQRPAGVPEQATIQAAEQAAPGVIHIQLRKARLRIEGSADPASLRAVLEAVRG